LLPDNITINKLVNETRPLSTSPLTQYLHFISREELRILAAIEMGMRNHEYVPAELITRIGNLRGGQTFKTIQKLLKHKFIVHIGNKCTPVCYSGDGYKLTYLGYDYLALHTFLKRGLIKDVLGKIGVGK
jgi:RIO kinase 2